MKIKTELLDMPMQPCQTKATDMPDYNCKPLVLWIVPSCGSKNNLILQSLFSHFYECCILFFFPTVQARCSFFLQNNNTSFKWSSFFEAQRVEAFSISLAVSNQLLEALACVINFAANMGQLKHTPIQRSHLLSIPLGRKGNGMCLLCSAEAREQSRSQKKILNS